MYRMSNVLELVVYTASLSQYADPLLDVLDPAHCADFRLFREHCTLTSNGYVKDLSQLGRDLKDVIIVDNSPNAYAFQPGNALPIPTWVEDQADRELGLMAVVLEGLAQCQDVRGFIPGLVVSGCVDYIRAKQVLTPATGEKENLDEEEPVADSLTWMARTLDPRTLQKELPHKAVEVQVSKPARRAGNADCREFMLQTYDTVGRGDVGRGKLIERFINNMQRSNETPKKEKSAGAKPHLSAEKSRAPRPVRLFANIVLKNKGRCNPECKPSITPAKQEPKKIMLQRMGVWRQPSENPKNVSRRLTAEFLLLQSGDPVLKGIFSKSCARTPSMATFERTIRARGPQRTQSTRGCPGTPKPQHRGKSLSQSHTAGQKRNNGEMQKKLFETLTTKKVPTRRLRAVTNV